MLLCQLPGLDASQHCAMAVQWYFREIGDVSCNSQFRTLETWSFRIYKNMMVVSCCFALQAWATGQCGKTSEIEEEEEEQERSRKIDCDRFEVLTGHGSWVWRPNGHGPTVMDSPQHRELPEYQCKAKDPLESVSHGKGTPIGSGERNLSIGS